MEFQLFSVSSSSHQSLQKAKSGLVERTAMFEIARLGKFSPLSYYSLNFRAISVIWLLLLFFYGLISNSVLFYFVLFEKRKALIFLWVSTKH